MILPWLILATIVASALAPFVLRDRKPLPDEDQSEPWPVAPPDPRIVELAEGMRKALERP